jgi:cell division protein FtsB
VSEIDELRARQEALETANDTLHEAFRGVDGDAHTALEVARQNTRLMTALRATQLEHGRVIAGLVTDVTDLKTGVSGLKTDVTDLKTDVTDLKTDVSGLKTDMADLKTGLAEVLRRLPG